MSSAAIHGICRNAFCLFGSCNGSLHHNETSFVTGEENQVMYIDKLFEPENSLFSQRTDNSKLKCFMYEVWCCLLLWMQPKLQYKSECFSAELFNEIIKKEIKKEQTDF